MRRFGRNEIMGLALAVLLVWLICGILAYGLTFAYFQRQYPTLAETEYESDFRFALSAGMAGPIGLGVCLLSGDWRHGFKWK